MPLCVINTNVPRDRVPQELGPELTRVIADTLNKPLKAVNVMIHSDVIMCQAGSDAPCAHMELSSIGVFDEERNPSYAKTFIELLSTRFLTPCDRITVVFQPLERTNVGHALYADMLKKT